jgi:hypothetical protein
MRAILAMYRPLHRAKPKAGIYLVNTLLVHLLMNISDEKKAPCAAGGCFS